MNYLLDTHIFLWYINEDPKLRNEHIQIIENLENNVYVSVISLWECIIKARLGKLEIPHPIYDFLHTKIIQHQLELINLETNCLQHLEKLPDIHKDPFDRLLICQVFYDNLIFITDDSLIKKYSVQTI